VKLKVLCPQWGSEQLDIESFLEKAKKAGFDGIDTWVPEAKSERSRLRKLLEDYDLMMVSHQHQATGNSITEFCRSFEYYLEISAEVQPFMINSHSGRDWFSDQQNLQVIDTAERMQDKLGLVIAHETHRGRIGFCPSHAKRFFDWRPSMRVTADLSHWVCVTESYLENFQAELHEAFERTAHMHARVGFPEGPQVPDPRLPQWQPALNHFKQYWQQLFELKKSGTDIFTVTTEFGPVPYMWTRTEDGKPVSSQWELNLFMKDFLRGLITSSTA